jgi:serpin B
VNKFLIYLSLTLLLAACGGSGTSQVKNSATAQSVLPDVMQIVVPEFSTSAVRDDNEVNEQDLQNWVTQVNAISLGEFAFGSSSYNFVTAPYNQIALFALVTLGARETSLSQINDYFFQSANFSNQPELFYQAFNTLDQRLTVTTAGDESAFSSANIMWGQQTYAFSTEFLEQSVEYFGSELFPADFIDDPQSVSASYAKRLNDISKGFLSSETSQLASTEEIADSVLLISHMSQLNLPWQTAFASQDTKLEDFALLNDNTIEVPIMHLALDTQYFSEGSETLIALPGEDPDWTVYLLSAGDVDKHKALKNNITLNKLRYMQQHSVLSHVQLSMPQFSMGGNAYIPLGGLSIFDKENADLSGLSANGQSELYAKYYQSRQWLEVNELGLRIGGEVLLDIKAKPLPEPVMNGGSFSSANFDTNSAPDWGFWLEEVKVVNLNTPFLFFVYHNPTGTLLYSGNLVDPSLH